jgi:hypothetical protein
MNAFLAEFEVDELLALLAPPPAGPFQVDRYFRLHLGPFSVAGSDGLVAIFLCHVSSPVERFRLRADTQLSRGMARLDLGSAPPR